MGKGGGFGWHVLRTQRHQDVGGGREIKGVHVPCREVLRSGVQWSGPGAQKAVWKRSSLRRACWWKMTEEERGSSST